jgi:hypothetical protein
VCLDSCSCRVGSQGAGSIPRRRGSDSSNSKTFRHADCNAHSSCFKGGGRISGFVFDQEPLDTEASCEGGSWHKRSPTFTERDWFKVERQRQEFAIAPERGLPRLQFRLGNIFGDRLEIVLCQKGTTTLFAYRLQDRPIVHSAAKSANKSRIEHGFK